MYPPGTPCLVCPSGDQSHILPPASALRDVALYALLFIGSPLFQSSPRSPLIVGTCWPRGDLALL